jgi:hypothetical protein
MPDTAQAVKTPSRRRRCRYLAAAGAAGGVLMVGFVATPALANPGIPDIGPGSQNIGGVRCIQSAYNFVAGTNLAVDGQYGPATTQATENFQRFFKLTVDGIVGPQTGSTLAFIVNKKAGSDEWDSSTCNQFVPS